MSPAVVSLGFGTEFASLCIYLVIHACFFCIALYHRRVIMRYVQRRAMTVNVYITLNVHTAISTKIDNSLDFMKS